MRIEYLTGNMVLWSQLRKTISEQIFKLWIRVSTRPEKADILLKFLNLLMNRWIQNRRQLTMNRGNPLMVLGKKIISFPSKYLINYATFQRYSSHFSIGKRARFHFLFFFFSASNSKVPNVNSNGVFVTICVNTVVGLTRVIKKRINRIAWMVILNSYYPAH